MQTKVLEGHVNDASLQVETYEKRRSNNNQAGDNIRLTVMELKKNDALPFQNVSVTEAGNR